MLTLRCVNLPARRARRAGSPRRCHTARFGLTAARVARLEPQTLVMHPGPMNRGVEIAVDPAELPGAVITRQVTNGIAVRMAVLFDVLSPDAEHELTADAQTGAPA